MIRFKVKHILLFLIFGLFIFSLSPVCRAIAIREGTFIKVISPVEISTLLYDKGDNVCFINSYDIFIYETNVLPQSSVLCGYVEDLLEPVQGKNGAIKIRLTKATTPDKKVYDIDAYIYSPNANYIGGEITTPMYYQKVPHYSTSFKPMLQFAPINVYEQGVHKVIKAGTELLVIFNQPMDINE